jgi:hypothetical protein
MSKEHSTWRSERLDNAEVRLTRWGMVGTPVLIFPTAAGDSEECERMKMVDALAPLLAAGRIKIYSVDSVAGASWLDKDTPKHQAARMQNRYDAFVVNEVVPAIRVDCRATDLDIMVAGASIGAFNALASVCRHPDLYFAALCLSGTYDLQKKFMDNEGTHESFVMSPLHFLPQMQDGEHLRRLRERFVLLAHGKGRWESPEESWRVADALGAKGVPNRVDEWGTEWDHDWPTWRRMMPQYLGELLDRRAAELAVAPLAQVAVPAASPAPSSALAEPAAKPARKPTARKKPAK